MLAWPSISRSSRRSTCATIACRTCAAGRGTEAAPLDQPALDLARRDVLERQAAEVRERRGALSAPGATRQRRALARAGVLEPVQVVVAGARERRAGADHSLQRP